MNENALRVEIRLDNADDWEACSPLMLRSIRDMCKRHGIDEHAIVIQILEAGDSLVVAAHLR